MNAGIQIKFDNNYHVELIEASTGKVKQSGDFHNTILKGFSDMLVQHPYSATGTETVVNYTGDGRGFYNYNSVGYFIAVGSGTTEPSVNNTGLARQLWQAQATGRNWNWIDDYSVKCTVSVSFPATSSYVGTVSEVGLRCRARYIGAVSRDNEGSFVTRALLTDSEGSVITFNKTDLDVLTISVTVQISLSSTDDNFKLFRRCFILENMVRPRDDIGFYRDSFGLLNLCRYYYDIEILNRPLPFDGIDKQINNGIAFCNNASEKYIRTLPIRVLATDVTSETYYKAVAIPGLGYWKLPNENIFPAYSITDINIGTGDGTTTKFTNPLCYFKKDTEKIYKNGVQLTRDVDYTINNIGNRSCLPELVELNAPAPIKTYSAATYSTTFSMGVPFITTNLNGSYNNPNNKYAKYFSSSSPLYIEYEEAVTFNCLKSNGGWGYLTGSYSQNRLPIGTIFYLDASTDGETYEEVGSTTITADGTETESAFTINFEDTTAKYWRLRTNYTDPWNNPVCMKITSNNGSIRFYTTLNKKDPYITFTEAPAEGDTITMDVQMDMLMKNNNFVFDISSRIDFEL